MGNIEFHLKTRAIVTIALLFFLSSCSGPRAYEEVKTLPQGLWFRSDVGGNLPLEFVVEDIHVEKKYNVDLIIHYEHQLSIDKVFTYLAIDYPDGQAKYLEKTIRLKSAEGLLMGEAQEAHMVIEQPYLKKTSFNAAGRYVFRVGNLMDKYQTSGILKIGLRVTAIH